VEGKGIAVARPVVERVGRERRQAFGADGIL